MTVLKGFEKRIAAGKKSLWVLLDPDRQTPPEASEYAAMASDAGADLILVGTSILLEGDFKATVTAVKKASGLPVMLFPASSAQVCAEADAILYMSLISGRNPQYLIEEQVRSAPMIRKTGIEAVSCAYMLVGSGDMTAVNYMSNTLPIPADKADIAAAHALAAKYMGMKTIYLEGGSGCGNPVPGEMISAVKSYAGLPLICGGGIKQPDEAESAAEAGADAVVVGTAFEKNRSITLLKDFRKALK